MALQKEIVLENGMVLNYHRVVSINKITNFKNNIEIASYINSEQREKEKKYQEIQIKYANEEQLTEEEYEILEKGLNIIIETSIDNTEYDESITIENVYDYLKTLPQLEGAIDV